MSKSGAHWPVFIIALLVANAAGAAILVFSSMAGESHYVEKDYYQRAVHWDQEMIQQRDNARLGWQPEATLRPTDVPGQMAVELHLVDRGGAALAGAEVVVEAYHRARANRRYQGALAPVRPGLYVAVFSDVRAGIWELSFTATRAGERFTHRATRSFAPAIGVAAPAEAATGR